MMTAPESMTMLRSLALRGQLRGLDLQGSFTTADGGLRRSLRATDPPAARLPLPMAGCCAGRRGEAWAVSWSNVWLVRRR